MPSDNYVFRGETIVINTNGADLARVGDVLVRQILKHGDLDGVNSDRKPEQRWFRDGVEIPNTDSHKYTVTADDVGQTLTAEYAFYDGNDNREVSIVRSGMFVTDEHIEVVRAFYPYCFDSAADLDGLLFWADILRRQRQGGAHPAEALQMLAGWFGESDSYEARVGNG